MMEGDYIFDVIGMCVKLVFIVKWWLREGDDGIVIP